MTKLLGELSVEERRERVLVVDNDLEGSCGLKKAWRRFEPMSGLFQRRFHGVSSFCTGFLMAFNRSEIVFQCFSWFLNGF